VEYGCKLGRNLNDDSIVGRSEACDRAMLIRRECVQNFFFREISSTGVVLFHVRSVSVAAGVRPCLRVRSTVCWTLLNCTDDIQMTMKL
jgi:hypothetical protein